MEKGNALLLKVCKLAKEINIIKHFDNISFNNFVEVKENHDVLNDNLFSDDNSD